MNARNFRLLNLGGSGKPEPESRRGLVSFLAQLTSCRGPAHPSILLLPFWDKYLLYSPGGVHFKISLPFSSSLRPLSRLFLVPPFLSQAACLWHTCRHNNSLLFY